MNTFSALRALSITIFLATLLASISALEASEGSDSELTEWARRIDGQNEERKMTHLHFYFHDTFGGENATSFSIAQSEITTTSPTFFGVLRMADDPLTEGPDPTSKLVGRARGLWGSAGRDEFSLIMAMSFVFTEGKYNGSSLSMLSNNPEANPTRELAIVGGTGVFRMAQGVAVPKTYLSNDIKVIVEYDVTVLHY